MKNISVIIPSNRVSNTDQLLSRLVGYGLRQIIVVSTIDDPDFAPMCKHYGVEHYQCLGQYNQHQARELGLSKATGEYVHMLDDDDVPYAHFYELKDKKQDLYFSYPVLLVGTQGTRLMSYKRDYAASNVSCWIFRRAIAEKAFKALPVGLASNNENYLYIHATVSMTDKVSVQPPSVVRQYLEGDDHQPSLFYNPATVHHWREVINRPLSHTQPIFDWYLQCKHKQSRKWALEQVC